MHHTATATADSQKTTRRCIFCGAPANSREHPIAEWLSKRMGIRELGFHPGHFSENEGLDLRPLIKCEHLKTKQVCKDCNSGWMSELEAWAQQHFGECIEPNFQPHQLTQLQSIRSESEPMIRWLLKTAIMLEHALPQGEMIKVVPSLFPVARGTEAPTEFHVWAAYIYERGFNLHVLRGFSVWNGGVLQPYQIHAGSMNFGLQLNHLALRLFRCPSAHPWVKGHIVQPGGVLSMPMWLSQRAEADFPHNHIYPTLESFMDALEVCANPPQGKETAPA